MPRQLIFITIEKIKIPACDSCAWKFLPDDPVEGDSLKTMIELYRAQLERDFAAHDCSKYQQGSGD